MKHEAFLENDLVEATSMFIRAGQALEKGLNKLGHVFYQQIVGDAFYKLLGKWKYWTQGRIAICSRSFFGTTMKLVIMLAGYAGDCRFESC